MKKKININLSLLTFLLIPLLFLWNPNFLKLMGVQPHWSMFWLFPWASIYGSFYGFLTGLSLGIVLDSLNHDVYTQIPGMVICGVFFGKFSQYKLHDNNKFKYGLICSLGSLICNSLYFCQVIFHNYADKSILWFSYGIKNIFAQLFLTGLLGPIICSWLFYLFRKNNIQHH